MVKEKTLPPELGQMAERETWFSFGSSEHILTWLDHERLTLVGIDTAQKLPDGKWALLLDGLDLGSEEDPIASVQQGRDFIAQRPDADLMFELIWRGR
jgi:hypothetical protein